jgi:hypothetical protein
MYTKWLETILAELNQSVLYKNIQKHQTTSNGITNCPLLLWNN